MKFPKKKPARNDEYKKFIEAQKCHCCPKSAPSVAHHIYAEGIGTKCSDYQTMPLCHDCHMEFHNGGRPEFAKNHGLDYWKVIASYLELYIELRRLREGR
jgi:hypothetical protein